MKFYQLLLAIALVTLVTPVTLARTKTSPAFVGGLDHQKASECIKAINQSSCKTKDPSEYKICVKKILASNPECWQCLAIFKLTNGGVLKKFHRYNNLDLIIADYVYLADQGIGYFIIMPSGQLISLPKAILKKTLKASPGYATIVKHFPHFNVWQILDFEQAIHLPNNRYRLIFTQQLKDGCNACKLAGFAKVAYDFSSDGKQFYGVTVLKLTP